MTFRRWFAAGLAGAALAVSGWWSGSLYAQVSEPSAFSETYGNWTVRCAVVEETREGESGERSRQCVMEQRFVWEDPESGRRQPLLTVSVAPLPDAGGMEAVVLAPFGLRFESGLRLRADETRGVLLSFHTCFANGCIARAPLDPDMIKSFRAGSVLHVEAEPAAGGDPFRLEGSLNGFTHANERLLGEVGSR